MKKIIIGIICLIIVIGIIFVVTTKRSPEKTLELYVNAFNEGNISEIVDLVDFNRGLAFENMIMTNSNEQGAFRRELRELKQNNSSEELERQQEEYAEIITLGINESRNITGVMTVSNVRTQQDENNRGIVIVSYTVEFENIDGSFDVELAMFRSGLRTYIITLFQEIEISL